MLTVAKLMASSPGLSRRSRSGWRSAQFVGMAGASPAMTKWELPEVLPLLIEILVLATIPSAFPDYDIAWFSNVSEREFLDRGPDRLYAYDCPPGRIALLCGRSVLRRISILGMVPRAGIGIFLQAAFAGLADRGGRASLRPVGSVHPGSGAAHEPWDQPA